MIENYKGWDIALTWTEENVLVLNSFNEALNKKQKWVGINYLGKKIYGSSLKEIRHIIDYPDLHK